MPKLTKRLVDAAQADTWCSEMPGFGVRVHPGGRRVYVVRYRTRTGRQRLLTLGRAVDLSADQARDMARQVFAAVAAGADPAEDRRERRAAPTVTDLRDRYMREHAPRKKSGRRDAWNWDRCIGPRWGARKISEVTTADVAALHASMRATPTQANHVRALISKAWSLAAAWGWHQGPNPAAAVPRYPMRARERVLSREELARMDAALSALVDAGRIARPAADLFRLLALTGCRLTEVMHARRDWVDVERRLLVLPDSKTGPRAVQLPVLALQIIEAMPASPWLIPGRRPGRPMARPYAAWALVLRAAALPPDTRIHDLRHTFGSHGHRAGHSQRQIADLLGHRHLATTARYLHGVADGQDSAADVVAERVASGWHTAGHVDRGQGPRGRTTAVGTEPAPRQRAGAVRPG